MNRAHKNRCWLSIVALALACDSLSAQAVSPQAVRIELGRKLFFDPRLSVDNSTSCASCHDPNQGWADGRRVAIGLIRGGTGLPGKRNTPSIINAAFTDGPQFWDLRAASIRSQATQPISNPIEMGQQTIGQVVNRLNRIAGYQPWVVAAFGSPGFSQDRMAAALEAFERTVSSLDAPIDRYLSGDAFALSKASERGLEIFDSLNCAACHKPPLYTDALPHNVGTSLRSGNTIDGRPDNGRAAIVGAGPGNVNVRAFKTPSLREVVRTSPYMHDGSSPSLQDVVAFHVVAGGRFVRKGQVVVDPLIDPRIRPVPLSAQQQQDLASLLAEGFASANYPHVERPVLP